MGERGQVTCKAAWEMEKKNKCNKIKKWNQNQSKASARELNQELMSLKPNRGKSLKSLTLASISLQLNKTQVKPEVADCTGSIYLFDGQDVDFSLRQT